MISLHWFFFITWTAMAIGIGFGIGSWFEYKSLQDLERRVVEAERLLERLQNESKQEASE